MNDREYILERIRQGLGAGIPSSSSDRRLETSALPERPLRQDTSVPPQARIRRFRSEAELQSVVVHEAADAAGVASALAEILDLLSAKQVMTWDDPVLERSDVAGLLREKEIEDLTASPGDPTRPRDRLDDKARAARAQVGITAADWALADTGTLVLLSAPGRSRAASLLPPVHVAVLPASRILADLGELVKLLPSDPAEALSRESSLTLITGTSKTADIELTLVRGVHGPGELHVILTSDEGAR